MRIEGKLWFSEQVVQMLVEDIRASLYREITPEQVSLALQETSDRLAKRLDGLQLRTASRAAPNTSS